MSLPTLETLATLAAAMASPSEEPETTAARALAIWRASDMALRQAVFKDAQDREHGRAHYEAILSFDEFLGKCLGRDMSGDVPAENEKAQLQAVLKALMPQKTVGDRMAKWRKMRRLNVIDADEASEIPKRNAEDLGNAVAEVLERDRIHGIAAKHLGQLWHCFNRFDEADRVMMNSEKGKHAAAAKKEKAHALRKAGVSAKKKKAASKKPLGGKKSSSKTS